MLGHVLEVGLILSLVYINIWIVDCSQWKRILAANDQCSLPQYSSARYNAIYESTEKTLRRANIDHSDLCQLYQMVSDKLDVWRHKHREPSPVTDGVVPAMSLLKLSQGIRQRDCLDYCTFVLAHNNCDAAKFLSACRPSMRRSSIIGTMIDSQVMPMIERCHKPLLFKTIELNATAMDSDLHRYATLITDALTIFRPTEELRNLHEAMLASSKPIHYIRTFVQPHRVGFCNKLFAVMQQLEALKGHTELAEAIKHRSLNRKQARAYFNRLIRKPCRDYIERLYKAMDASIFYGRIIELDRSRFKLDEIAQDKVIQFYELLRRYDTCAFLEDYDFSADWPRIRSEIGV